LLQRHLHEPETAPDGRPFRGARGGILSESLYGRVWHTARQAALGPVLAATPLARRPYDLRHVALSLWLTASGEPAEVAALAGNSVHVLQTVYAHRIDGHSEIVSQHIGRALGPQDPSLPACLSKRFAEPLPPPNFRPLFVRGRPTHGGTA
jgi:integrase